MNKSSIINPTASKLNCPKAFRRSHRPFAKNTSATFAERTRILLTIFLLLSAYAQAQDGKSAGPEKIDNLGNWKRSGQASMPFLKMGAGAKYMAMGDAGIANVGDATALFYNPAGIAHTENNAVMLSSMSWLMDTKIQAGAAAINVKDWGVIGISAMFFDYGAPIKATEINAGAEGGYADIGEMSPSEWVMGIGFARRISSQFAIGAQIKYAYQDLLGGNVKSRIAYNTPTGWVQENHDASKSVFAFDVGTMYNTGFRNLMLAMSFRNFGQEVKHELIAYDIPLTFAFGVSASAFEILNAKKKDMDLHVNIDYSHVRDWSERMNFGLEYAFMEQFFLRGGYKQNYSSEGMCAGGGAHFNTEIGEIRLDYAYKDSKDTLFDAVHVYSLCVYF